MQTGSYQYIIFLSPAMVVFHDEIPESLVEWIKNQRIFWVATAPMNAHGHVNLSPKGGENTFHVVHSKKVYYEDLTGSGVETISHLRENGRITILFNAFDGPPRILRLWGIGTVYEYGTPEYNSLIQPATRQPGSRAAIVVNVLKVSTSCGFAVPLYNFVAHRTRLHRFSEMKERVDRAHALPPDSENLDVQQINVPSNSLREYWLRNNMKSLDGLPGLLTAPDALVRIAPQNNFQSTTMSGALRGCGTSNKESHVIFKHPEKTFILGFFLGAVAVAAYTMILGKIELH
ncbi:hypothetical protein EV401DRAFT_1105434 [Pisolithus croceorrhizus]|nr:hypothetical protein EV401DRAFT_1105434 [Pisolithus croceorrhizus]